MDPAIDALLVAMPKAELHIHLEGAIRPATLLALAQRHGVDIGCRDLAGLRELYRFRDFRHFIELYGVIIQTIRAPEDFVLIAEELGRDAAAQGTRYLETTFTMGSHVLRKGLPFEEIMDALATAVASVRRENGVEIRFILDHVRGWPPEECQQAAEWCVRGRDRGVVALGLGGYEPGNPASLYAEAIRWVQAQGLPFVPHAGEAAGPGGIWDALAFGPPRIGHGIRAVDDPALVTYLRDHGIVLEICPTSNVCTGSVPSLAAHPLRRLWDAGVPLTINSDDPPMFGTTLLDEYRLAVTHFGFTPAELAQVSRTAIGAALLPAADRARLVAGFEADLQHLGLGR
ncbi:MAG TPA: adenosine deaminase [Chloroflexia bacterium]|nr:adenosine deaminase [Chloroflexia bacterium]